MRKVGLMIRIVNLRSYELHDNEVLVRIDRTSVLGNPFVLRNECDRSACIAKYKQYFKATFKSSENVHFLRELRRIFELALEKDIALACWCAPKACHGDVIASFLNDSIETFKNI